ncbi:MAG: Glu/Leu/Phe/Val dehydrogenase [Myxococcales bacterium]|nr:Glu/Leu/Phe/Val dehydrogenase [Myxococcales bacterium]
MRFRGAISSILCVALVLAATMAHADPLPGLLSRSEIDEGQAKASQQKQDAQRMVRRRATKLGYSEKDIARALQPAMLREGKFRVTLHGAGVEGIVVELPWYRIGFAENAISNTDKVSQRSRETRFETNKGGVRLHKGVFRDEVYALALKMDTKLGMSHDGLQGYAVRGAKGGIGAGTIVHVPKGVGYEVKVGDKIDPAAAIIPRAEVMRGFARGYMKQAAVGPGLDIQAGDVNTKAPEMKVLSETYGTAQRPSPGVSGKELMQHKGAIDPRGGIAYRAVSTGDGVWMSARLAAKRAGLELAGATVAAQGWGEVGKAFAESAIKDGARLVAVQELFVVNGKKQAGVIELPASMQHDKQALATFKSDIDAIVSGKLDLASYNGGALLAHFKPGGDTADVKADIVGLNAMGNVLTANTVPRYVRSGTHRGKRKVLVEGANLAADAAGSRRLTRRAYQKWLISVPGDLANVGGVHVSNLEAAQNAYHEVVTSPTAQRSLQKTIDAGWAAAMKLASKHGISEREAIELAAVDAMMKRSLHRQDAPIASVDDAVISVKAREVHRGAIARWARDAQLLAQGRSGERSGLATIGSHLMRHEARLRSRRPINTSKTTTAKKTASRSRSARGKKSYKTSPFAPRWLKQFTHHSGHNPISVHTPRFTPRHTPRRIVPRRK